MTTVAGQIAHIITDFLGESIEDAVIDRAQMNIADTIGCLLAGAHAEEIKPLKRYLSARAPGSVDVPGMTQRLEPAHAAMALASFGHAYDFDDVLPMMPGHPSVAVLGAALAAAPPELSGRAFVEAYLLGIEVAARIGAALGGGHYKRGWHTTGSVAIFGAVAAIGRLRNATTAEIETALGYAATTSSGLRVHFGTMAKPFHAGWAAHNAMVAADLALAGATASPQVFEGKSGFFAVYGTAESDPNRILPEFGQPFVVESPGLSIKKYPCYHGIHRSIDAMLALRSELDLRPETVAEVHCTAAPGALATATYARPQTGLEGKFSLDYILAAGILDGKFGLSAFTDAAVNRPAIQALYDKVGKSEHPRCFGKDSAATDKPPGSIGFHEVTARLIDGRSATVRVEKPIGTPGKELGWSDVEDKFMDCANTGGLSDDAARRSFELWRGVAQSPQIGPAIASLRG